MLYLYDDARITYLHMGTAAQKAESEHEDHTGEGICMRSIQAEGKDNIATMSEQIAQLWLVVQKPQNTAVSNPLQFSSEKDSNRKK